MARPGREMVHLSLATALALGMSSVSLGGDLYGDERGHTYPVVALGEFWSNLGDPSMCHPPVYFLLARAAWLLVGQEWALRLPSLLFAAGTVAATACAAARVLGPAFFVPAAYAAALSPFLLEFATEARAYAAAIFFSVLLLTAFMRFLEEETAGRSTALVFAAAAGALTHYFAWFQILFLGGWYLAQRRGLTRRAAIVVCATALVLAPFAVELFVIQRGAFRGYLQADWSQQYFAPGNFLGRLAVAVVYGYNLFLLPDLDPGRNIPAAVLRTQLPLLVLLAIAGAGFLLALLGLIREKNRQWLFLVLGVAVPAALALAGGAAGLYLVREKHLSIIWIPALLLQVLLVDWLRRRRYGRAAVACHLVLVGIALTHGLVQPALYSRKSRWDALAASLAAEPARGDIVVSYRPLDGRVQGLNPGAGSGPGAVVLGSAQEGGSSLETIAAALDREVAGRIYLVTDETDRNIVDPGKRFASAIGNRRSAVHRHFGRNLRLTVYAPGPAP